MSDWNYNPEVWAKTRTVTIAQDGDMMWRWRRNRTGPEAKEVSTCVSGGFEDPKWCYRNAVKENLGLTVTPPEGVEVLNIVPVDPPATIEGHDGDDHVTVPPQPES
jgi:hypothetical protein